jgi:hypothetical protein
MFSLRGAPNIPSDSEDTIFILDDQSGTAKSTFHLHRSRIHHKPLIYHLLLRMRTLKMMILVHLLLLEDTTE